MNKKIILSLAILLLLTIPAYAEWDTSISRDEMTGKILAQAHSLIVAPTKKLASPYNNLKAVLAIVCDKTDEWVYVNFTMAPNLSNTETKDGYSDISTRIKWDDKVEDITLSQDWGAKSIHFDNDKEIVLKITKSNFVLLELNWYSLGKVYFKFPLAGSSAALKTIRSECAK
jgi:hypothetical protein